MRADRGFSLLEILVVLTILGISGAAVLPAMRDWAKEGDLDEARREVVEVLTAARLEALGTGRTVSIVLDPVASTYRTVRSSAAENVETREGSLVLPPGARLVSRLPVATFEFSPLGPATGDGLVIDTPEGSVSVTVDP